MAQQTIGIGAVANDGTGDPLRTAFDKTNDNFDELYALPPGVEEAAIDGHYYSRKDGDWAEVNTIGGMSTAEYTYNTTTTAPPGTGTLRGNNSTQSAITQFWLHETNAVGVDITNALKLIASGVKILVQDKTNSANVQYYQTSGPAVDNGAYFTIPVTWTATGSGSAFTAGRVIFAGFGIGSSNMTEAPTDGAIYARRGSDASWQAALPAANLTGGKITIASTAPGSPAVNDVWIDTT